jgi:phage terminase small subunit
VPRKRDPNRDKAFEIWKMHKGDITNRAIAEELDVPEKTISAWKSRDKWNAVLQKNDCSTTNKNPAKKARSPNKKEIAEPIVESDELTDKQRLFCMYYLKYFNATKAYQKAYDCAYSTARVEGSRSLAKPNIKSEINRMKEEQAKGILLDASFVLQKYIDIAFSDITDYLSFGQKEQQVMTMYGPLYEKGKDGKADTSKPVTETVNYVDFKESHEIDGTIITEVKQGKDGVSIKLADKMKALEFLSKYTDLLSENDRKKLQEEKLKAEIQKAKSETKGTGGTNSSVVDFSNLSTEELRAIANSNRRTD